MLANSFNCSQLVNDTSAIADVIRSQKLIKIHCVRCFKDSRNVSEIWHFTDIYPDRVTEALVKKLMKPIFGHDQEDASK